MWHEQVTQLQERLLAYSDDAARNEVVDEIRRGYETGVAIAIKQRQFELAHGLVHQMLQLEFAPTIKTYEFLVRVAALELLSGPAATSADDLREILDEKHLVNTWERELLTIIRLEESPHYLKTAAERKLFRRRLIEGVETVLNDYERSARNKLLAGNDLAEGDTISSVPFNEALCTYADNDVPFTQMLKLMVQRAVLPDVETYAALLQGARWTEIPATVTQLLQSGIVDKLSAPAPEFPPTAEAVWKDKERKSYHVHLLWSNAMKAVINSFMERFFDRNARVYRKDVEELQKVFLFVDKQLSQAFPKYKFATTEHHDEVFALRAKAAATCGLRKNTLKVLDDYVSLAPSPQDVKKDVFLVAMEIFTWSQLQILNLSRQEVLDRSMRRDVSSSRRVAELERVYNRVKKRHSEEKKGEDADEGNDRLSRNVSELEYRLEQARILKSYQLMIQSHFERADEAIDAILEKLVDVADVTGYDVDGDIDVCLKLMEQYMTCATRYEKRLSQRRKDVGPQVMRRVFRVIKDLTKHDDLAAMDKKKLNDFFFCAMRTAALFWRYDDIEKIVRKKKRVLGVNKLDAREYDLLIFLRVTKRDVQGAYALLEEMHNAGMAPSKDAIHRIVLGLMHQLLDDPDSTKRAPREDIIILDTDDDEEVAFETEVEQTLRQSDKSTIEEEMMLGDDLEFDDDTEQALTLMTGTDAPASIVDIASFLQDWYNLHRVKPAAKTVVPVLARLIATKDFPELSRLLQILESMDGGLTPATTVWLEKRLAQIERTIDDFRV